MNPIYDYARDYWKDRLKNRIPTRTHNPDIVEYAEQTVIATGIYRGRKMSHERAPYLKRPMWCLSPASPFREVVVMFPSQSGKTFTANTAAMYYIEKIPSEIIYVTSDDTMAAKWLEREIEPRASQAGIIFKSEMDAKTSRRTGNTSISKLYPGGNIDVASANSAAQLASATKRIAFGDEVDRWKIKLGEQGSVLNQIRARTQAWDSQAKIFWFSTPASEDVSVILQLHQLGDQELYYVPCPYCGTMQLMDFYEGRGHGLHWEHKAGRIYKKSIELICESPTCQRGIKEAAKPRMLLGGDWRAQAIPQFEHIVSFNLNGLYSFQLSWYDMVVAWEEAQRDPLKKQDFDQLKMGRPHKESGKRIKADKIIENRGTYKSGTVPDGVLFLTAFVDVQEGSENNEANPPRLEMEILGIGSKWRTWSICYEVFRGEIVDPESGAWAKLTQWAEDNNGLNFYRNDGFKFPVQIMLIDSGSGKVSDIVYHFCESCRDTFPSKGMPDIRMNRKDKPDEIIQGNRIPWRRSVLEDGTTLYLINTNYYKTKIFHYFNIERVEAGEQKGGYCTFPADYSDWYFQMFTAEEKRRDGSFHNPGGRRNEALDCRVGCMCASDIFLAEERLKWQMKAKTEKWPLKYYNAIDKVFVLNKIQEATARKK